MTLDTLFRPRSIALVGATERSAWSNAAWGNLEKLGFGGDVHLVNRKGGTVYGRAAATACTAIGEPVDTALIMVPVKAIGDTIDELGAAGIRNAIVLTSGFAESGEDGRALQTLVAGRAQSQGIRLLGPNCLGFINYVDRVGVWTTPLVAPRRAGNVAIVSQSGAVASMVRTIAQQQGVDPTYVVSTGNEMDVTVADVIEHLADEPTTRAIALFLEGVRDPDRFAAAARKARDADKPLICLKIGTSEKTAASAQAHTGALTGDDRIFDAVCADLGIVRVASMEEMVVTADLMATVGPIRGNRVGFMSMSGGVCEIASDRAEAEGLVAPALSGGTIAALQEALPGFGHPQNPLDITGEAMNQPELFDKALSVMGRDPAIDALVCFFDAPGAVQSHAFIAKVLGHITSGMAGAPIPGLVISHSFAPVSAESRALLDQIGVPFVGGGLQHGVQALGRAVRWWAAKDAAAPEHVAAPACDARPASEREVLDYLESRGVPVVPTQLVRSPEEARAAAEAIGEPVVLKIASPDIAHKSEIGGVDLDVRDAGAAFEAMMARVREKAPEARIDGVLVAPLRRAEGVELLVGISRDPLWGLALTVAIGGVLVEILKDSVTRMLPIDEAKAMEMLGDLRASALLDGYRGAAPVDRAAAARAIAAIAAAAEALGPELKALEVNPLRLTATGAEALDGLAIW